jgi:hypothetical protein
MSNTSFLRNEAMNNFDAHKQFVATNYSLWYLNDNENT